MSDKCCELCKFYAELKQPYIRSDKAVIYGYCFKLGDKNYSTNMGKGFPVFISGGVCKSFRIAVDRLDNVESQLDFFRSED